MPGRSSAPGPLPPSGLFYGWRIVGTAFLCHFMGPGLVFYCYGVFFKPLQHLFGWSRLAVAGGLTVISLMTAIYSPLVARIMNRRGIRWTVTAGACILASGFLALRFTQSLWRYYATLGLPIAFGGLCMGALPANTLVANWFERNRGKALGAATAGLSLSGLVLVPAITAVVQRLGLLDTYLVIGLVILLVVVPPALSTIVDRPEDMGLGPDGEGRVPEEQADVPLMVPASTESAYLSRADYLRSSIAPLRQRIFWRLLFSFALVHASLGAILIHMIPHFTDLGFSRARAALALSFAAGAGVLGKVVFGYLSDHFGKKGAVILSFGVQAAGTLLLLTARSPTTLYSFSCLFGFGMGGVVPLQASVTADIFGRRAFASVSGLTNLFMVPIMVLGAPLAGWIYDHYGSYDPAWKIFLLNYSAAILLFLRVRVRRRTPR
jgi:MFS family permease